jgi:tRNA threonylcarbamoyladenosine biosynthesis protein TsaB
VPTLDALARTALSSGATVCALLDAKMDEVYAAWYASGPEGLHCLEPAFVAPIGTVMARVPAPAHFLGDGALRYAAEIRAASPEARLAPVDHAHPRASAVAMLGLAAWRAGAAADPADFAPVYLRRSQAEENAARVARASAP